MHPLLPARAPSRAAFFFRKLWPIGSVLRVHFLGGTAAQRAGAMAQAGWWTPHVNLSFVESTDNDAEIRVSFDPSDGAWSYIGTDCRSIPADQPTMNLGFEDGGTAAHEFGHAIGLGHEHQNPQGGIEWNEPEVIRDLSRPPNSWTLDQIRHNVLDKYSLDQLRASEFDPKSIMLYFFPARWTKNGVGTSANNVLSEDDKAWAAMMYPKSAVPSATRLTVGATPTAASIGMPGEEDRFVFAVTEAGTLHHRDRREHRRNHEAVRAEQPDGADRRGRRQRPRAQSKDRAGLCPPATISCRSATTASGSGTGAYTIGVRK